MAQNLPIIAKSLKDTLLKYVSISDELSTYLPKQFATFQKENNLKS
ncbi:hypothetical protein GPUN_2789 [Glaciecola punicea ACAM 611]|uniref:Uncharacterized protein n=1 Tax=Glaciecola punicea ACAM 611 TaxID=1121923 RepID=H5TEX6_9ALTE|nr:hypothetical protein GPUN_2789 [Glaciecola punicea ACAM 611]